MNNAAAIASTLGIQTPSTPTAKSLNDETIKQAELEKQDDASSKVKRIAPNKKKSENVRNKTSSVNRKNTATGRGREVTQSGESRSLASEQISSAQSELPMLIDIKMRFPGKELFVLCLLYLQRNQKGLVQMTVNQIMSLYGTVFTDVIKDDTVRRSLKRLFDGGFIKTTSIPGNNSGYIYQIEDLLETNALNEEERQEFGELIDFAKRKLNI